MEYETATQTCPKCGKTQKVLADEVGDYDCFYCGFRPEDLEEREEEREEDGVWVVLDNRTEPGILMDKFAWYERKHAENHAFKLRNHYRCSLDAITVTWIPIYEIN